MEKVSVTFRAMLEQDNVFRGACEGHRVSCDCEEFGTYFSCDHTWERMDALEATCESCSRAVNVSNANAAAILERLGVEFDYCGHLDASDILGRAMVANVNRDDSGIAWSTERGSGGATLHDCGLRAGYFGDRMAGIAELATWCAANGYLVGWS